MSEPSGRELDAQLACMITGIKPTDLLMLPTTCPDHIQGCLVAHYDVHFPNGMLVPHYSGDAWPLVAEEMRQKGYALALYWMPDWEYPKDSPRYRAEIDTEGAEISTFLAAADTPGAAVALAAYRALRAEEEK